MIRLIVYHNKEQIKTYQFEPQDITIGRLPENVIPIASMSISRKHAVIKHEDNTFTVYDNDSLNGTYINNKKVKSAKVSSGDRLSIGDYELEFRDLDEEDRKEGESDIDDANLFADSNPLKDEEIVIPQGGKAEKGNKPSNADKNAPLNRPDEKKPKGKETQTQKKNDEPPSEGGNKQRHADTKEGTPVNTKKNIKNSESLKKESRPDAVLIDKEKHVVYKLNKSLFTIGNGENDDIYVNGFFMEEKLATIERKNNEYTISTKGRMKKIKINEDKVHEHKLQNKDIIEIGNNSFRFMLE